MTFKSFKSNILVDDEALYKGEAIMSGTTPVLNGAFIELYSSIVRKGATSLNGNIFFESMTGGGTGVTRSADAPNKRVVVSMGTGDFNYFQFADYQDHGFHRATSHKVQLGHDVPTGFDSELRAEFRYNNRESSCYYVLYATPTPATHGRLFKWELIKKETALADVLLASSNTNVPLNTPFTVFIYRELNNDLVVLLNGVELFRSSDNTWIDGFQETWFGNATTNNLTCYRYDTIIYRRVLKI